MQQLSWQTSVTLQVASARRRIKQLYVHKLAGYQLTPQQLGILVALCEGGPASLRELAARARCDEPTASRIVSRLTANDWVAAHTDPTDRRCAILELTSAGNRLAQKLVTVARSVETQLCQGLSNNDLDTLRRLLDKVVANTCHESNTVPAVTRRHR